MSATKPLTVVRGKTLQQVIRWEKTPVVRKPITAIDLATGAPRITATGHGIPNGWRAYCYGIKGTKELNVDDPEKVKSSDYLEVTVVDANTVEFNSINAADFTPYTSGGFIAWNTPHELSGYTCRVKIKDKVGGTVLLSTEAGDSPLNLIAATVDDDAKTVTIKITATTTEALTWKKGVWEVEMVSGTGDVFSLIAVSPVTVVQEVVV